MTVTTDRAVISTRQHEGGGPTAVNGVGSINHVQHAEVGEGPPLERGVVGAGDGGCVAVGESEAEGVEDGVQDVELDLSQRAEESSEESNLGSEEGAEERSDELGNDDGSEDSDEEREELGDLAQIEVQGVGGSSVGGGRGLVGGGLVGRGGVLLLVGWGSVRGSRGLVGRGSSVLSSRTGVGISRCGVPRVVGGRGVGVASSISQDSSEEGNGDDDFVHVEGSDSEMFTMSV